MRKGFTLLELLIVVVILGVLALIAAPALLNAADAAKDGAVQANVSAASSSVVSRFALHSTEKPSDTAAAVVAALNTSNKNPFGGTATPFAAAASTTEGVVTIVGDDTNENVTITGHGKGGTVLITKVIAPPSDN